MLLYIRLYLREGKSIGQTLTEWQVDIAPRGPIGLQGNEMKALPYVLFQFGCLVLSCIGAYRFGALLHSCSILIPLYYCRSRRSSRASLLLAASLT